MKFPESWLREHVHVDADRATLAATLTAIGLEVEALNEIGVGLDGVVVAQIIECSRHPEADRLQVCRVSIGSSEVQIVCGAPNARAGLKAPLATIGTRLPGGMEIKAAKLRGVDSQGMLCSAKELGVDPDASGLLELPADAPVGESLATYLSLPDASFELKLTPNRADCFSLRGVAYDVAAALGSAVTPMAIEPVAATIVSEFPIRLDAEAACPRYCGRVIEGIDAAAPTPLWMSERLKRAGIRPISLLVDVTQYVMLELGQPMHAFDFDALRGAITVRDARAGERIKLLDEREVAVEPGMLLIADDESPLALAGIMGGWDSRVTTATRNVFLESAHFAPASIIGRARKLGLHTDASHRFERGVDPELPRLALERATELVLAHAGGRAGPVTEATLAQHLTQPAPVHLRRDRLQRVLGMSIADATVERILGALGMHVSEQSDGWQVTAPTRRFDIAIEEDLIEEIARINGYDAIPLHAPSGQIRLALQSEAQVRDADLRAQLAARGWFEAINFAFLDAATIESWSLPGKLVPLANPLSADLAVMRPSLLPGLVNAVKRNLARQQGRVRLFEIGRTFVGGDGAPTETLSLAGVACGAARSEQWSEARRDLDFHDLRGDIESLLALRGQNANIRYTPASVPWLHPGQSADVHIDDRLIGTLGSLHPRLRKVLDLDEELWVFELQVEPLSRRPVPRALEISRYPAVRRDLAVVVPESTPWSALEASLRGALGAQLRDLIAFDRYVGPGLEAGCKSLAMGLILQDAYRTLTEADVDQAVAAAVAALERDCGAKLRG